MNVKQLIALSALASMAHGAIAHTHTTTYPIKAVLDLQPADNRVAFYFGDAAHPVVAVSKGDASASIRIARKLDGETASCNAALTAALASLKDDALSHGANAVIDIETSFHGTHSTSSTDFVCATSFSAASIRVRGKLAMLEAK